MENRQFTSPPPNNGNFYTDLTNSDYQLAYDGTNYTLTRLSDNVSWSAGRLQLNAAVTASSEVRRALPWPSPERRRRPSYLIQPTRELARNIAINPVVAADVRQR